MALHIVDKYRTIIRKSDIYGNLNGTDEISLAIECASISVIMIMSSNPTSNPFNTAGYSTMEYWNNTKEMAWSVDNDTLFLCSAKGAGQITNLKNIAISELIAYLKTQSYESQ
jgi:hypothetical protein